MPQAYLRSCLRIEEGHNLERCPGELSQDRGFERGEEVSLRARLQASVYLDLHDVCVCIYIYIYIYIFICLSRYVYVCMYVYVRMYPCMHGCLSVSMHVCRYVCL